MDVLHVPRAPGGYEAVELVLLVAVASAGEGTGGMGAGSTFKEPVVEGATDEADLHCCFSFHS